MVSTKAGSMPSCLCLPKLLNEDCFFKVFQFANSKGSKEKWFTLPSCNSAGPGSGAESLGETAKHVTSKLDKNKHVAACDGSPALHAAAALSGTLALRGVSHLQHLFTPLCNIPKKGLSRPQQEVLRSLTTQGCCVERRHCFTMVGGDNVAESMASVTKHQLRRHGLSRNAKDPIEHRNTLAVHYLNKNPGLEAVLSALARFRTTVSQGLVAPSRAFLEAPWEK